MGRNRFHSVPFAFLSSNARHPKHRLFRRSQRNRGQCQWQCFTIKFYVPIDRFNMPCWCTHNHNCWIASTTRVRRTNEPASHERCSTDAFVPRTEKWEMRREATSNANYFHSNGSNRLHADRSILLYFSSERAHMDYIMNSNIEMKREKPVYSYVPERNEGCSTLLSNFSSY